MVAATLPSSASEKERKSGSFSTMDLRKAGKDTCSRCGSMISRDGLVLRASPAAPPPPPTPPLTPLPAAVVAPSRDVDVVWPPPDRCDEEVPRWLPPPLRDAEEVFLREEEEEEAAAEDATLGLFPFLVDIGK